ncbi:HEAT repeat domain-containing protein [Haladaptatus caseinilyticus]|uniref:HEAT repeat domain-containing protein n=1 Tax=Haladaptatus caseinilyticus TaxID=2993314 RepID=UPI00224B58DE|nr:HEAT repeat domain-containing protein [Haladaptatus caseinilyticus]
MAHHDTGDGTDFLSRARNEPATVPVSDAVSLLTAPEVVGRDGLVGAIVTVIEANPDQRDHAVEVLRNALSSPDPEVRNAAATVVGSVAENRPTLLSALTPSLVECLDDDATLPRINATHALMEVAPHAPDASARGVQTLAEHLESEFPNLRELAARCLLAIAQADSASIEPAVPALLDVLPCERTGSETEPTDIDVPGKTTPGKSPVTERMADARTRRLRLRVISAETIATVAREDPSAVPLDDRLLDAIEADVAVPVRRWATDTVAALVRSDVDNSRLAIDPLVRVVGDSNAPLAIRGVAAETLAHCAEIRFEETTAAARSVISDLGELLSVDDQTARAGSAALLTYLTERFPDEASVTSTAIRAALDAESDSVRARAAFALGYVADSDDRRKLASLRENDPSEAVRGAADVALRETNGDPDS